jgi:signal transduction histidine kinase
VSIRTRLLAALTLVITLAVSVTGVVLIVQHTRHERALIAEKQLLLVEHAAFALQGNLSVAARELSRIAKLPEMDPEDSDTDPERQLLYGAHENSVLFETIRELDSSGRVKLVHPPGGGADEAGRDYSDRRWFDTARRTHQPFFYTVPERAAVPEAIGVVVPLRREGTFNGAIQGVLDLRGDRTITSELVHTAGATGELAIVDREGRVLFPAGPGGLAGAGLTLARAELEKSRAGSRRIHDADGDFLYAWAPVGVGSWGVVMRWPWATLSSGMREQVVSTVAILVVGVALAGLMAFVLGAYVSLPLLELGQVAQRLARGEPGGVAPSARRDEIGALMNAFAHMESELARQGARIREDLETISRLNASLEERVAARTRELQAAQARLLEVERFAAMGKTAAAIAHEVRNALNGLGMCVDLVLADTRSTAASMRVRAQIHHEIARLRDITESLLTFSRTPRIDRTATDLNLVAARALEVCAEQIADGGVTVVTALGTGGATTIECDGYKLQGVIINLVKNAVEAMTTRPLDLEHEPTPAPEQRRVLTVAVRRGDDGTAIVEVRDTGPGLTAEARSHLFEPFFTTKVTGTGLGLATARRIVEAHGGRIEIGDAGAGEGTVVTIHLPQRPVEQAARAV